MIFKDEDAGLADNCLAHAKDLYDFAINYKAKYSDSSPQVGNFYNSWSGYQDEGGFQIDVVSGLSRLVLIGRHQFETSISLSGAQLGCSELQAIPIIWERHRNIIQIMLEKCSHGMIKLLVTKFFWLSQVLQLNIAIWFKHYSDR